MSPEQAAGEPLDGRSDLYSLGVVAFFAVTGRLPFEATSAGAVMAMHLTQAPPRVASLRPDLPQALCAAIDRCLEKEPAKRFESGEALAAALDVMRASRREVSPAVRMFQQQATQAVRAVFIVVLMTSVYLDNLVWAKADAQFILILVVAVTVLWGIFAQMVGRARYLMTLGHSFDEVRDGLGVILAERAEARAQEFANLRARQRAKRATRIMLAAFALSIAGFVFVIRVMRVSTGVGTYRIGMGGFGILAVCAALFGIGIALAMMNPGRSNGIDRQIARLWCSGAGRAVFRLAGWTIEREATQLQRELRTLEHKRRALEGELAVVSGEVRATESGRPPVTPQ